MENKNFKIFTYTTSKEVERVIVNVDNISNIVEDGNNTCLIYFTGDRQDCVRVDGTIENTFFKLTGLRI